MTTPSLKATSAAVVVLLVGGTAVICNSDRFYFAGLLISQAEARVGRPATPMSYAGVARRTTRRAVTYGAAAGAAAAGAYYSYPAPGCYQVVNSYGQIVYRCP